MKSHFMAAPTLAEMGGADSCAVQEQMNLFSHEQLPQQQMGSEEVARGQQMNESDQSSLTPEQADRLTQVMARQARGGGHLTDGRHLGDMPDVLPPAEPEEEPIVRYGRGYYVK